MAANARTLHRFGYHLEADRLLLEAAELHIELRHPERAGELLAEAGRTAGSSAVQRAAALRITASLELLRGRPQRARRAVNQGVRILNDHHAVLGAIELRAFAAASSVGLARIGVQLAVDDGGRASCSTTSRPRGARCRCSPPLNRPTTRCWPTCWRGCDW